jgi:hypothetical protein
MNKSSLFICVRLASSIRQKRTPDTQRDKAATKTLHHRGRKGAQRTLEKPKKETMSSRRPSGARAFFSARVGLRGVFATGCGIHIRASGFSVSGQMGVHGATGIPHY